MTCIVGLVDHHKNIWMGGDRAATGGQELTTIADPKVFTHDQYIVGYSTSFRMGQILKYVVNYPYIDQGVDPHKHMVTEFVPAYRAALLESHWVRTKDGRDEGGQILVGLMGQLFVVQGDFSVLVPSVGYAAIGSGGSVALGSLHATTIGSESTLTGARRVTMALEASEMFTPSVSGPFDVVHKQWVDIHSAMC